MAASCQLSLVFCFIGAMLIRLFEDFSLVTEVANVQRVMVFSSTVEIAAPLIATTFATMLLMLVILVFLIQHEGRQRVIRVVDTRAPPELKLHPGQKYHLCMPS